MRTGRVEDGSRETLSPLGAKPIEYHCSPCVEAAGRGSSRRWGGSRHQPRWKPVGPSW